MIDIDTGEIIDAEYKLVQIKGGIKTEKFCSSDINEALKYLKWHAARYKEGLLMEINPLKKGVK